VAGTYTLGSNLGLSTTGARPYDGEPQEAALRAPGAFRSGQRRCTAGREQRLAQGPPCDRLRKAMRSGELAPFGGNGGVVEADETFIGHEPGKPKKRA
jgi:hypothetical protein